MGLIQSNKEPSSYFASKAVKSVALLVEKLVVKWADWMADESVEFWEVSMVEMTGTSVALTVVQLVAISIAHMVGLLEKLMDGYSAVKWADG